RLPYSDQPIRVAAGEPAAIGRKGQRVHSVSMAARLPEDALAVNVPDAQSAVPVADGQFPAIRAERHARNPPPFRGPIAFGKRPWFGLLAAGNVEKALRFSGPRQGEQESVRRQREPVTLRPARSVHIDDLLADAVAGLGHVQDEDLRVLCFFLTAPGQKLTAVVREGQLAARQVA